MKTRALVIFSLIALLVVLSCNNDEVDNTVVGSGNRITEVRSLDPFHSLELWTVGEVNLRQGAKQEVSVTISDNLMQYVSTRVSNGTLVIDVDGSNTYTNFDLTVDVWMTDLERLINYGAGTITGRNRFTVDTSSLLSRGAGNMTLEVEADLLTSGLEGAGQMTLRGTAQTHQVEMVGTSTLRAFDLITENTTISTGSIGNAEIHVTQTLIVTISGLGSVYYKGRPTITQYITGGGSLIDANDTLVQCGPHFDSMEESARIFIVDIPRSGSSLPSFSRQMQQ
jgi:hypothetical protein